MSQEEEEGAHSSPVSNLELAACMLSPRYLDTALAAPGRASKPRRYAGHRDRVKKYIFCNQRGGCSGWTRGANSHQKWWFRTGGVHNLPPSTCASKWPHDVFTLCFIEHLVSLGVVAMAGLARSTCIQSCGFARELFTIYHHPHVSPNGLMMHLPSVLSSIWLPKGVAVAGLAGSTHQK